ncbi:LVIVD repeat-containing protein [Pyxidicoccus sp. 3LFB2]
MKSPLVLLSTCVLLLSTLSGCDEPGGPGPTPDAGSQLPDDSGMPDSGPEPWDGGYTVLEERGDWIDRGPYAPCGFDRQGDPAAVRCDDLSRYDLSQCSPEALAQLGSHGIYLADLRGEVPLADGGTRLAPDFTSFKLHSDGGTDTLNGEPLVTRNTDGGSFFVVGSRKSPFNNVTTVTALAGCRVPSPGIVTGCYTRCNNGKFSRAGTFEAHRMPSQRGEPESSGGLHLISESRVLLGDAVDVYVTKNHAYVVSINKPGSNGGLTVFDVSDRAHPIFKASISLPGDSSWNGVWAKDDALYIAGNSASVVVYDISNPAQPEYVRHLPSNEYGVHTVLVDGNRLYGMSPGEVTFVYDVTTPLAPVLLQRITLPAEFTLGGAHDAFAYEGRLYISNGYGGYSVLDVTDLDNVRHLGQYVHNAYAHHSAVGTFAGRTIAFEGAEFNGTHVRVLDVTDPANIAKIGEFRLSPVTSIHNMLLVGSRLYIAWYHEGVRVLDVSNPTKPRQVAHYNTFRESDPGRTDDIFEGTFGIRVPGDGYVYAADSVRGLLILNEL